MTIALRRSSVNFVTRQATKRRVPYQKAADLYWRKAQWRTIVDCSKEVPAMTTKEKMIHAVKELPAAFVS